MIRRLIPIRIVRDEKGVTLVEFAMILPALVVLLLGIFELGYRSYAASLVQGALHEAARMSTVGGVTMTTINNHVRDRLGHFAEHGTLNITTTSYYEYTGVGRPETITTDTAPLNQYNSTDCFEDANGNGTWDADRGRSGQGNSDDIVRYQISISYESLFPIAETLGWDEANTITANTVLRNQPYAGRSVTNTIICPTP